MGLPARLHARGLQAERAAQRRRARGQQRQHRVRVAARQPLQPLQRGLEPVRHAPGVARALDAAPAAALAMGSCPTLALTHTLQPGTLC